MNTKTLKLKYKKTIEINIFARGNEDG